MATTPPLRQTMAIVLQTVALASMPDAKLKMRREMPAESWWQLLENVLREK